MTLILWKAPVVDSPDEAKALLDAWYENGDDSAFEASEDIARVADSLRSRWPDWETEPPGNCPWADMPFEQSDRLLAIHARWGADDAAIAAIYVLARKHELILYDPQGPDMFLPADPLPSSEPIPPPSAFDWFKAVAIAVLLVGLTYAAWLIPIGWLRWPALVVAGFVAAAGLFVLGAMIAGALGIVDVNATSGPCHDDRAPL